ncbi:hypothetical protein BCR33DRAFT_721676 [Rhizoclosmatium globosum]|uniref:Uncharacterized protein n=1 Tax=Rhizoclosmatium globosum TaxID=329046 RepID=A0A1Y2BQM0_9FUNG|nr:hypothetical protein BCR33DRAFT_721676 [Rhizoclosmatium globosum]|eukprot:ORY37033.1 hypothetical protein BCR33DRAFT_721676 [Rhizoclosmatium globosum]
MESNNAPTPPTTTTSSPGNKRKKGNEDVEEMEESASLLLALNAHGRVRSPPAKRAAMAASHQPLQQVQPQIILQHHPIQQQWPHMFHYPPTHHAANPSAQPFFVATTGPNGQPMMVPMGMQMMPMQYVMSGNATKPSDSSQQAQSTPQHPQPHPQQQQFWSPFPYHPAHILQQPATANPSQSPHPQMIYYMPQPHQTPPNNNHNTPTHPSTTTTAQQRGKPHTKSHKPSLEAHYSGATTMSPLSTQDSILGLGVIQNGVSCVVRAAPPVVVSAMQSGGTVMGVVHQRQPKMNPGLVAAAAAGGSGAGGSGVLSGGGSGVGSVGADESVLGVGVVKEGGASVVLRVGGMVGGVLGRKWKVEDSDGGGGGGDGNVSVNGAVSGENSETSGGRNGRRQVFEPKRVAGEQTVEINGAVQNPEPVAMGGVDGEEIVIKRRRRPRGK